jgi:ribose transport system substrate-binding protein
MPEIPEYDKAYADRIAALSGQTVDTAPFKKDAPYTIAVLTQGPFNGWGKTFEITAQWAAENNPNIDKTIFFSSGGDLQKQVTQMEQAVAQKPDAIVLHPNGDALAGPAKSAMEQGIPVILCGNGLPDDTAFATMITDDYWNTGLEIAEMLIEDIGGQGNIVIMGGNPAYEHTRVYVDSANYVFAQHPGVNVIATVYSEYQIPKGKADMEAVLASNPTIDAIYTTGSEAAIGAIQALSERNLTMPAFSISNDLNGFNRLAIEHGFKLSAAPNPAGMSAACVTTAVDILQGKEGIARFVEAQEITPKSTIFDESEVADRYYEKFNDDFVGPPIAPDQVYLDAGFGR